uniref:receptor protein-tyrosine kinase n=1 Tax=Caenorhabditis tropicalis TaxID=1561998 RepID=A0A1I7UWM6_9PELO
MSSKFHVDWKPSSTAQSSNEEQSLFPSRNFEIEKKNLLIKEVLNGVKDPKDQIQYRMVMNELAIYQDVQYHPNLLEFKGFVINDKNPPSIVFKYSGEENLLKVLRRRRSLGTVEREENGFVLVDRIENSNNQESIDRKDTDLCSDLTRYALDIAEGMEYLASLSYVHRDVALRNMYITSDGTVRIGDLGLARKNERTTCYTIRTKEMPLSHHWMAPETFEHKKFTKESDVWSYGVCLHEIFTLGDVPYKGVEDMLKYLNRGRRLAKPDYCNEEIYEFMKKCWDANPKDRPTFADCVSFFKEQVKKQENGKDEARQE